MELNFYFFKLTNFKLRVIISLFSKRLSSVSISENPWLNYWVAASPRCDSPGYSVSKKFNFKTGFK